MTARSKRNLFLPGGGSIDPRVRVRLRNFLLDFDANKNLGSSDDHDKVVICHSKAAEGL